MKRVLTLAMAAFLVVSSTGFALAQDPAPAKEPILTGDGSEYVEMAAAAATDQQQDCFVTVPGLDCGGADANVDNIVAFDFSHFPQDMYPEQSGSHCELTKDLQASGYNVRKVKISLWALPEHGSCVDTLVITSLADNMCLMFPAYSQTVVELINTKVGQGLGLLLLNEWGDPELGAGCGVGTAPIANALGAIWNATGKTENPGGAGPPSTFTVNDNFYQGNPEALFWNVSSWEGYSISDYTSDAGNRVTNDGGKPVMVAKEYGAGCTVIVGDTNWAADGWIDFANTNNRSLANNVFGYLENCGLWADPNGPYSGSAGTEIQFDGTGSVDDRGEPITSYVWDFGDSNSGTEATPTHSYIAAGDYEVCLTVSTDSGRTDTNCTTAYINGVNVAPVADANGPYLGAAGSEIAFDGTDSFDPDGGPLPLTYDWDFDENPPGSDATLDYIYYTAGIYDVCLTVSDGIAENTDCTQAVVYDRLAGFVTGSGGLDSDGDASFAINTKYTKDATVPTGQTSFVWGAGTQDFESTGYEWLVVTNGDYATFKGTGTINGGTDEYLFRVWAGNGATNTFSIKIWQEDALGVETVIKETVMDQTISYGNVVVHDVKK